MSGWRLRVLAVAAALAAGGAQAQTVKVGVVLPFTGVGAEFGQQVDRGMQMFLKLNPGAFAPYKVELVKRDSKNPSGAEAKTAVQELIAQEKVDILAGFIYSPDAIASAPLATAAKKPMIVMNAGTAWITNLSPMISRVSFSMWHSGYAMGEAAAKTLQAKTAVVGYSDFPPGKDSLDAFRRGFESSGGKVVDAIPMGGPGQVPDFTPFFQRAKDRKPDVFYVFVPSGDHAVAVTKAYAALGMRQAGIKLIGPGDLTPDHKLQAMGDDAVGLITAHHYNADLDNPANKRFVAAWKQEYGAGATPDFMGAQGYDGMAAIVHVVRTLQGRIDPDKAQAALKGWKYADSPRGPIMIDAATRDIVMNEYLSELVKVGGRLVQKNIGVIPAVKDMCKELKEGKCAQ
ncbi:MAG: ABC transporter substrate-binding protein [Betaproteobacteria bacterium]|nr:ABC transporter substrate-binding protein [Betaproteobacteria bacterium]MDH5349859.1 ABC transporter substrate-binding protein [Betaproteobacteria bacterium]